MSNQSATVVLGHKTRTYKGEEKHSFNGIVKIKGKEYLLTVSADEDSPIIYEGKKEGTPLMYVNVIELKPQSQRKRKNEL